MANIRRRELGLRFWYAQSEDPRRYKWLQLTVHMPPRFATNIEAWAENEARLEPGPFSVDEKSITQWNRRYGDLRDAFWKAPEVTDKERRFLWFGEIRETTKRLHEATARGDEVIPRALIEEILQFARTYPEPMGVGDKAYWSTMDEVIGLLFGNGGSKLFSWNREAQLAIAHELDATKNTIARRVARKIREADGEWRAGLDLSESEAYRAWGLLPRYPSNSPFSQVSRIVFYHDVILAQRKTREIGASELWTRYPDHEFRLNWLSSPDVHMPAFPLDFVGAIQLLARDGKAPFEVDRKAEAEWNSTYARLREELWTNPATTIEQRGRIRAAEIGAELRRLESINPGQQKSVEIQLLLDSIHDLYTKYHSEQKLLRYAGMIVRKYPALGLSHSALLSFVKPMSAYKSKSLRDFASSIENRIGLRETPFAFSALTLRNDPFDIADLHGQIVLVDHWGTSCASCIAAMPGINETYGKYKDKGFQVVSIAYDATSERKRVLRIKDELNLDEWITLDGEGQWEEISTRYGYQGWPQYMLLNRDGTLYAGTAEVDMGRNLEALLEEMLAAEAAEKEAATIH